MSVHVPFCWCKSFRFPISLCPFAHPLTYKFSKLLWVSFSSCSFTFSFLERLGGKRVNKIENLAKTSIIGNVNFWWGNAVGWISDKDAHGERTEGEERKATASKGRRKALLGLQEMEESLFWSVGLTSERLGQHLPLRCQAQCRLQEQNKPGEPASGDVVECQELKQCLLLKVCGSGWHWLFFLIGLILMLSPAPRGMNHQRAIPAKREQDWSPSCIHSWDTLSKAGTCFIYFSGEFDS